MFREHEAQNYASNLKWSETVDFEGVWNTPQKCISFSDPKVHSGDQFHTWKTWKEAQI